MSLNPKIKIVPLSKQDSVLSKTEVEKIVGIHIPESLVKLLPSDGQAAGFNMTVEIEPQEKNPLVGSNNKQAVSTLFGLGRGDHGIVSEFERLKDRIHGNCIPIADDSLGNAFVIDTLTRNVLFWHHECQDGEGSPAALSLVSRSMEDFIDGLLPGTEPNSEDLNRGVKRVRFDF
ncbi:SMI1/KNR4 family protein [Pseudaestuariivita rosea]|uniref:SMI1/KNR4 family protein n=1 Tax=Pseudaestuariivita rosea TaxID=2763263 RepID=UPI001ABBD86A|nr:SMI1/KNR4 family protein [Pseudaestuariivita rosea]